MYTRWILCLVLVFTAFLSEARQRDPQRTSRRARIEQFRKDMDTIRLHLDRNQNPEAIAIGERILSSMPQSYAVKLNMSQAYNRIGSYERTISLLDTLKCPSDSAEATRLVHLSTAYAQIGSADKAIPLLQSASAIATPMMRPTIFNNLGFACFSRNDYSTAVRYFSTAMSLFTARNADYYTAMANLAIAEALNGNPGKATAHIDSCIAWQQENLPQGDVRRLISWRKKAEISHIIGHKSRAFRSYFDGEKQYLYDQFLKLSAKGRIDLWKSHRDLLAEGYAIAQHDPAMLFDIALFSKSVLMQVERDFDSPDPMTFRDFTFSAKQLTRYLGKNDCAIEFVRYNDAPYGHSSPAYAAIVLKPDGKTAFIPLFSEQEFLSMTLPDGTPLEQAMRSSTPKDKRQLYAASTPWGHAVWQPIIDEIGTGKRIFFCADGFLHLLAIEYLYPGEQDRLYRFSSLKELRHHDISSATPSTLLLGGLDYNMGVSGQASDTLSLPSEPSTRRADRSASAFLRSALGNYTFSTLPASLTEVKLIADIDSTHSTLMTADKGTETAFKQQASRFTHIHLATHGYCLPPQVDEGGIFARDSIMEDVSMRRCGLAFSGANIQGRRGSRYERIDDGILSAEEAGLLQLGHNRMIVLSACQTAQGDISPDGVFGLCRGFKKAGARQLVVSLWEVDDAATARLMQYFYRHIHEGISPHEALLRARVQLRDYTSTRRRFDIRNLKTARQPYREETYHPYSSPYFWAAFILLDPEVTRH